MDWRTILAVAISVVLIIAVPLLIPVFFPGDKAAVATSTPAPAATSSTAAAPAATGSTTATSPPASSAASSSTAPAAIATGAVVVDPAGPVPPDSQSARVVRETDTLILTFDTAGADVSSIKLKEYRNVDGSPVELVLAGESAERPFALAFGDYLAPAVTFPFVLREYAEGARRMIEFSQCAALGRGGAVHPQEDVRGDGRRVPGRAAGRDRERDQRRAGRRGRGRRLHHPASDRRSGRRSRSSMAATTRATSRTGG